MKATSLHLILGLMVTLLSACSNLTTNENVAQVLLGRTFDDLCQCMGGLPHNSPAENAAQWDFSRQEVVERYAPPTLFEDEEGNLFYIPEEYSRELQDHSLSVTAQLRRGNVQTLTFFAQDWELPINPAWSMVNQAELDWNRAAANDDLSELLALERKRPLLATREYRVRACLQAAQYDAVNVLCHYLGSGQVALSDVGKTWLLPPLSGSINRQDAGSFALAHLSVADILQRRNTPSVRERLAKHGIHYGTQHPPVTP